ncbi:hypothetical protein EP073_01155 [Geovibrio thiophilus]|uniref:Uncharacterized protein n=1 Tax=Geovibrio thiophilus TaxID=139438 RepID=A0A410JV15_9BACT|nr:hypothetical protein [Geovibrio thiophilus]QAR32057.1 hypothetical protein EP073_01155 [Geovibrio thiophilus]
MRGIRVLLLCVVFSVFLVMGCGGSSSSSGSTSEKGVFTDAPVQGLSYSAEPSGLSGVTNEKGEFDFLEGDNVTFRIGNLVLGSVRATAFVTPFDIADYDNAVDIARLLQSVGSVSSGVIVLDSQGASSVNGIVSDNMTLRDALDALETGNVITTSAEDALEHMNSRSIYGAYSGYTALRCEPDGYKSVDSVMVFDKGKTFAFNVGGYEVLDFPDSVSTPSVALRRTVKVYSGKRTSQDSFRFTGLADESELIYNISASSAEVFSTSVSSPDNSCSGTGFMVRVADAKNDNESCVMPEEGDDAEYGIELLSSNVYSEDNYTDIPRDILLSVSVSGCSITAEADFMGYDESDNYTVLHKKSLKGYADMSKRSIFLSDDSGNGSYSVFMISVSDDYLYRSAASAPMAIANPFTGYYFEYAEDNETGAPLWSLFSVGQSYK